MSKKGAKKKSMSGGKMNDKPPVSLTPSTKFGPSRGMPSLMKAPGSQFGSSYPSGPGPKRGIYDSKGKVAGSVPS